MPLWEIYHPEGTFTDTADREGLAKAITAIYTNLGIPAFYVAVMFKTMPLKTMYKGGEAYPSEKNPPFVRIVWTNIAGDFPSGQEDRKKAFLQQVEDALRPFLAAKGYDWEHHGIDSDVTLGLIMGQPFPKRFSPLEKHWLAVNAPLPLPAEK